MTHIPRLTVRIPAYKIYEKLPAGINMLGIGADRLEAAAVEAGLIHKSYRYHAYDSVTSEYVFIEGADRMADKVRIHAANEIQKLLPEAQVFSASSNETVVGIDNLIDAVKSLHEEAKRESERDGNNL